MTEAHKLMFQKIIRSFLISLFGAILAGAVVLVPEVTKFITSRFVDPIDWIPVILVSWGAFSSSLVASLREYGKLLGIVQS